MSKTDNESVLITKTLPNGAVIICEDKDKRTPLTDAQIKKDTENIARSWRDQELRESDWIIPLTDHPQHAAYITYRKALRDWPSTSDFPDKKPTLGS
jgi:hypothetical protein